MYLLPTSTGADTRSPAARARVRPRVRSRGTRGRRRAGTGTPAAEVAPPLQLPTCLTRHSSSASSGHSAASLDPASAPALRPVAEAELSHEPQRGGAAQRSCHLVIWQHRNNCGIADADIYRFHRTLARRCFVGETLRAAAGQQRRGGMPPTVRPLSYLEPEYIHVDIEVSR